MATVVRDILDSVRSKNAGPFYLTIDLFLPDESTFAKVKEYDLFKKEVVGQLYNLDPSVVEVYYFEPARAVKISMPREQPCGTPGDRDMLGGQQFTPLLSIPVPFS